MKVSKIEEFCRHLIYNRGWALWFRVVQWVFAVIVLALIAFSFSKFKGYPNYTGWVWGAIGVSFVHPHLIHFVLTLGYMDCSVASRSRRSWSEV